MISKLIAKDFIISILSHYPQTAQKIHNKIGDNDLRFMPKIPLETIEEVLTESVLLGNVSECYLGNNKAYYRR